MSKTPKRPRDANQLAKLVVDIATAHAHDTATEASESESAKLGRLGGIKGGVARAKILSPDERRRIAQNAAAVRWRKE